MQGFLNSDYICEDNGKFYLDTENYQDELGMKICSGELVKFEYNNQKYTAKTQAVYGARDLFVLKNVSVLVN